MSAEQLESLVVAVLEPVGSAAAPQRSVTRETASATMTPQLPLWRIRPVEHDNQKGMEATLFGTAEAGGRKESALLTVSCTKSVSADAYPHVDASASVRVHLEMVNFDTGHIEEKSAFHDNAGRSQLGRAAEIHIDVGASATDKGVRVFSLAYEEPDLKETIEAVSHTLRVTMMPETPGKGDPLVARFQLPADGAGVQSMMSSCFEMLEAEQRNENAKDVVACPVVEGKVLKDMEVLVGPSGKQLERDPDSDQIRNWVLPQATKTHPRPKLVMACSYGQPGYRTDPKETLEKKMLLIPLSAASCMIGDDSTENRNHAECSRP